jgi:endonuclease/exonuclease/phosphatase family metal-dependent hydrolase
VFALNFNEGPAVLSRFPITSSVVHDLPRCERPLHPRVMLETEVATPWGPLRVYSTHTERDACQHERVAEVVVARRGPLPSILMGDLNATEAFPSIAALVNGTGFVDAYRAANAEGPGLTVWQRIDADAPTVLRRVDYVLVLPGATMTGRVTASRIIVNAPQRIDGRTLWPSDHYGVLIDLVLDGP